MFGIGFLELVLIAVVILIFIGPKRLPEFMQQLGKLLVQFRRASYEVKHSFDEAVSTAQQQDVHDNNHKKDCLPSNNAQATTNTPYEDHHHVMNDDAKTNNKMDSQKPPLQ